MLTDGSEIPDAGRDHCLGSALPATPMRSIFERFEGAGVYYAATDLEARVCNGSPVIVIGGGNSAGQAALYLAENNCAVTIAVIRRDDLRETMSQYLIERIEVDPKVSLLAGAWKFGACAVTAGSKK